ncbi:uncharacterized protein METZ01_LOCUS312053, partial [marine metagenome]
HFNKIINQNYKGIYNNQLESTLAVGNLYSAKIDQDQKKLINSIQEDLLKIYRKAKASIYKVKLYNNLLNNITPLSIINAINNELINLKEEDNSILISEFNKIINEEIKNQPAPFIYEKIGTKYKNYFIDEFQDTSNLQWENLIPLIENSLSSENASLTIVGDAKQSIYRWRGSQVKQFIELINNTNPFNIEPNVISLPNNYRSSKNIVEFNNGFFTHISPLIFNDDYFKKNYLKASQEIKQNKEGYVNIRLLNKDKNADENQLYNDNVLEIINSCLKNGHQLKDICIITRKRKEGVIIADFLTEKGIDIISSESLLIDSSPDVRFILDTINYCLSEDVASKIEILNYLYKDNKTIELRDDFIRKFIDLD